MKKLLFVLLGFLVVGCEDFKTRKYVVVHHKNIYDTISTNKYTFYYGDKVLIAHEGGCFTQVEYIKAIE